MEAGTVGGYKLLHYFINRPSVYFTFAIVLLTLLMYVLNEFQHKWKGFVSYT